MNCEFHVARLVSDNGIFLLCSVVQKLEAVLHRVLRGSRLLGCKSAEWGEHSQIHRLRKVQEYAGDLLDKFLPNLIEQGGVVMWLCMLDFCPILFFDVWVRLVLWHDRGWMLESFECVFEVERH